MLLPLRLSPALLHLLPHQNFQVKASSLSITEFQTDAMIIIYLLNVNLRAHYKLIHMQIWTEEYVINKTSRADS